MEYRQPLYVVSNMTVGNGMGFNYPSSYTYGGGKFHHLGRGWLGFRWMQSDNEDASAKVRSKEFLNQTFPFTGTTAETEVYDINNLQSPVIKAESWNTYITPAPNAYANVYFVGLQRVDKFEYEGGQSRQSASTMEYDSAANGNLFRTSHLGDVNVSGDERTEETEWVINATDWRHRPKTVQLKDSGSNIVRRKWLYYDNQNHGVLNGPGLLTKEELDNGGAQGSGNNNPVSGSNPVTTFEYDPTLGNRIKVTDARGCRTDTAYESTNTLPATVTTCANVTSLNFLMTYDYDLGFGLKKTETDWNSQTTNHRYDNFGRLTKTWGPYDSEALPTLSRQYIDWGTPGAQRVISYAREQHGTSNTLWSMEYFDGLGRTVAKQQEGPKTSIDGKTIFSQTWYDSRNLVKYQWVPFFVNADGSAAETAYYTIFTYDALGRQTLINHPDGTWAVANYFLPGAVALTDENGKNKFKYSDVYGQLTQVTEQNGSSYYVTTYHYDSAGSLLKVVNAANHNSTMAYDKLGRKTAMCDPNMGTHSSLTSCSTSTTGAWVYTYSPAGDLLTQKDARNRTITFTYDELGRPKTKKEGSTSLVNWTFDTTMVSPLPSGADYPKGRVTEVHQPANPVNGEIKTQFAYDKMGRTLESKRWLLGVPYKMNQTYDALSRIWTETFPDSEAVTYNYNEAGWLKSTSATGTNYINDIQYNARGQKTQLTYGNGLVASWTHHATSFRVTNKTTSNNQQNLSYGYDNLGNVTSITDGLFTAGRTFTYDDLNRLETATGTFGPNQSQQSCTGANKYVYSAIGNLENKCGAIIGYTDAMHPSAATSHSGNGKSYTYDANGNMLTRGSQTLVWDVDNRVTSITSSGQTTYHEYDYTGMRVKKNAPAGITLFPFQGYEIDPGGTITKFIRIGHETYASKRGASKLYYHNDHLGSVNVITNEAGTRVQLNEYDPWGGVSRSEGNIDPTHRFTGKELDPESGLYYYGGRYYDHELGRFISADPFIQAPHDPQNLNRYSYVTNNPQNFIDPTGYFFKKLFKFLKQAFFWSHRIAVNSFFAGTAPHLVALRETSRGTLKRVVNNVEGAVISTALAYVTGPAGFGIFGGTLASAIGGAAGGAVSASLNGGNPLQGGAIAFVTAGLFSLAQSQLNPGTVSSTPTGSDGPYTQLACSSCFGWFVGTAHAADRGTPRSYHNPYEGIGGAPQVGGGGGNVPQIIYRAGTPSPSNLTPRPGESYLSFRDSLSNPLPTGGRPVFRTGDNWMAIDVSKP